MNYIYIIVFMMLLPSWAAAQQIITSTVNLPTNVEETSALAFSDNLLWTLNDSGNDNILFALQPESGSVQRSVKVINAQNNDWECLAYSNSELFIGDIGNNSGSRQNLSILIINKLALSQGDTVTAERITFRYPDQESFQPANQAHNFDCEAIIYYRDSLHLFTKNWVDNKTKHYTIPAVAGNYTAVLRNSFPVQGLITDAAITETGELALVGYTRFAECFMWLFSDIVGTDFLGGKALKVPLPSALQIGQLEAITFGKGGSGWISGEAFFGNPARLSSINITSLLPGNTSVQLPLPAEKIFSLAPQPATTQLHISGTTSCPAVYHEIIDYNGKSIAPASLLDSTGIVPIQHLPNGMYLLRLSFCNKDEYLFFHIRR